MTGISKSAMNGGSSRVCVCVCVCVCVINYRKVGDMNLREQGWAFLFFLFCFCESREVTPTLPSDLKYRKSTS